MWPHTQCQLYTNSCWVLQPLRAFAQPPPQITAFSLSSHKASPHPSCPRVPPRSTPFLQYADKSEF